MLLSPGLRCNLLFSPPSLFGYFRHAPRLVRCQRGVDSTITRRSDRGRPPQSLGPLPLVGGPFFPHDCCCLCSFQPCSLFQGSLLHLQSRRSHPIEVGDIGCPLLPLASFKHFLKLELLLLIVESYGDHYLAFCSYLSDARPLALLLLLFSFPLRDVSCKGHEGPPALVMPLTATSFSIAFKDDNP